MNMRSIFWALLAVGGLGAAGGGLFRTDNLLAWCIVPFDLKQRGPEERAAMLARLGLKKFVYDWREKDVPYFDREIDALQKHGIALAGFWTPHPASLTAPNRLEVIFDLIERRRLRTELWLSLSADKAFVALPDGAKLELASRIVERVARRAAALGCKVGLYNHGGWYGEPENQLAILARVKMANVGLVYNFHHGHEHVARFAELLRKLKPHLLAVNINGMKTGTKILPVGEGEDELAMLRALEASGYRGPVGILGHREELDAEVALRLNLEGLRRLFPAR